MRLARLLLGRLVLLGLAALAVNVRSAGATADRNFEVVGLWEGGREGGKEGGRGVSEMRFSDSKKKEGHSVNITAWQIREYKEGGREGGRKGGRVRIKTSTIDR